MATASGQRKAAMWVSDILTKGKDETRGQLEGYVDKGLGLLGSAVDNGQGYLSGALDNQLSVLGGNFQLGYDNLNGYYGQGRGDLQAGLAALNPYASQGATASAMYGNSLGLNGAEGNAAAQSAFQAGPGYQWQVDQGVDAAARKANALGLSASGNTLDALTRLGSNLANQEYGSWQDRLNGASTQGLQAANQQAGLYGNMATLNAQEGNALANLGQTYGQNLASAYGNFGQLANQDEMTRGTVGAGLYDKLGTNIANSNTAANQGIAQSVFAAGKAGDAARLANDQIAMGIGSKLLDLGMGFATGGASTMFKGMGNIVKGGG